jgi:hypothetical protein
MAMLPSPKSPQAVDSGHLHTTLATTTHITNWMGDDGFLVNAKSTIRRHNPEGGTLFIDGVTGKQIEGARHLVEIEQKAEHQDRDLSVLGPASYHAKPAN